jgi:hypothetical protein
MGQSQAATGMDRLPWLPDEPARKAKRGASELAALVAAAILLVAAASYWLGMNSGELPSAFPGAGSATTVALPPAVLPQPIQPQVEPERMPDVAPVAAPPMPVAAQPPAVRPPLVKPAPTPQPTDAVTDSRSAASAAEALKPWPVRVTEGASGRLVRIGAFSTAHKAKKGWWAIVRMNPALQRLPALVVPVRSLRDGRTYYRLQMGTTSQAHSEVLCQRMRMIGQGCIVMDVAKSAGSAK